MSFFPLGALLLLLLFVGIAGVQFNFGKIKFFAGATLENVQHIQASGLKVCGRIVRFRNENLRLQTLVGRFEVIGDGHKFLGNRMQQRQTGRNFLFRIGRFNGRRNHRNEPAL